MGSKVFGFVDGDYLRQVALELGRTHYPDPRALVCASCLTRMVRQWPGFSGVPDPQPLRVTFYDALPDEVPRNPVEEGERARREACWSAVDLLPDTHLGFGVARRKRKRLTQKGVDTLIAVDMIVGAFTEVYNLAVLVAGDADFVPVLDEVRRRGASVLVVAHRASLADDLLRAADRFVPIVTEAERVDDFSPLAVRFKDLHMNGAPLPLSQAT